MSHGGARPAVPVGSAFSSTPGIVEEPSSRATAAIPSAATSGLLHPPPLGFRTPSSPAWQGLLPLLHLHTRCQHKGTAAGACPRWSRPAPSGSAPPTAGSSQSVSAAPSSGGRDGARLSRNGFPELKRGDDLCDAAVPRGINSVPPAPRGPRLLCPMWLWQGRGLGNGRTIPLSCLQTQSPLPIPQVPKGEVRLQL